jgi:hypothetical protein
METSKSNPIPPIELLPIANRATLPRQPIKHFLLSTNICTNIYPKAIASNIEIEDIPPMTVVSLGLKGGYSYRNYREGLVRLEDWLKQHPEYEIARLPRRFFYDGPYIPDVLKRSEIQIPIRPN